MSFEYYRQTLQDLEDKITEQNPPYSRDMLRALDSFLDSWFAEVELHYEEKKSTYQTLRRHLSGRTKFTYRQIVSSYNRYQNGLHEFEMPFFEALNKQFPQYTRQMMEVMTLISDVEENTECRNEMASKDQELYLEDYDNAIRKYMDFLNSIANVDQLILRQKKDVEDKFNQITEQIKQDCPASQLSSKLSQLNKEYKQLIGSARLLRLKLRYLGTPVYQDIINLSDLFFGKDCFPS